MAVEIELLSPLLLHLIVSETAVYLLAGKIPDTWIVLVTSVVVLPPAIWMAKRDRRLYGSLPERAAGWRSGKVRLQVLKGRVSEKETPGTDRTAGGAAAKAAACAGCAAGGALMNALLSFLINHSSLTQRFPDMVQKQLLGEGPLLSVTALVILVPVTEELIFRGLLYRRMRLRLSAGAAIVLNTLLFAGYHGNMIQFVFAVPMGLILCVLYEADGSLLLPVLFHAGSNLAAVLWK